MEFVTIGGLALGEDIERNSLGLSEGFFPSSGVANICAYSESKLSSLRISLDDPQGAK